MEATVQRSRPWHVAEHPGHGCCFSVGIQDAEGNMIADVVYREDGPLLVAAPDLHAALREAREWILGEGSLVPERLVDRMTAALAKAEGRDEA